VARSTQVKRRETPSPRTSQRCCCRTAVPCPPRGGCRIRLGPKGTWSGPGAPNSSGADDAPPAKRRGLNHPYVPPAERGKPVALPQGKALRKGRRWGCG
jgi:hypothetical protein